MPYDRTRDPFYGQAGGPSTPSRDVSDVVPNDGQDLTSYAKCLYIGGAGDIAVVPVDHADETPVIFKSHPIGYLPVMVRRVLATGTTATFIRAMLK